MTQGHDEWKPDWCTHPGEHLAEYLEVRGWSPAEFAAVADIPQGTVEAIVGCREPVTPEIADRLERALGLKAHVWTNLQDAWDSWSAEDEADCDEVACRDPWWWIDNGRRLWGWKDRADSWESSTSASVMAMEADGRFAVVSVYAHADGWSDVLDERVLDASSEADAVGTAMSEAGRLADRVMSAYELAEDRLEAWERLKIAESGTAEAGHGA